MAAAHRRQALPCTVLCSRRSPGPARCIAAAPFAVAPLLPPKCFPQALGHGVLLCSATFFLCSVPSAFGKCAVFTFGLVGKPWFVFSAPAADYNCSGGRGGDAVSVPPTPVRTEQPGHLARLCSPALAPGTGRRSGRPHSSPTLGGRGVSQNHRITE